jgi:hypothetical protein
MQRYRSKQRQPYESTPWLDGEGHLCCISAMQGYSSSSHEELRWADHQGPDPAGTGAPAAAERASETTDMHRVCRAAAAAADHLTPEVRTAAPAAAERVSWTIAHCMQFSTYSTCSSSSVSCSDLAAVTAQVPRFSTSTFHQQLASSKQHYMSLLLPTHVAKPCSCLSLTCYAVVFVPLPACRGWHQLRSATAAGITSLTSLCPSWKHAQSTFICNQCAATAAAAAMKSFAGQITRGTRTSHPRWYKLPTSCQA